MSDIAIAAAKGIIAKMRKDFEDDVPRKVPDSEQEAYAEKVMSDIIREQYHQVTDQLRIATLRLEAYMKFAQKMDDYFEYAASTGTTDDSVKLRVYRELDNLTDQILQIK